MIERVHFVAVRTMAVLLVVRHLLIDNSNSNAANSRTGVSDGGCDRTKVGNRVRTG